MLITIDLRLLGRGLRSGIEEYTGELVSQLISSAHQFNLFYNGRKMVALPKSLLRPNARVMNWGIPNKLIEASMRLISQPLITGDIIFSPHFNYLKTTAPHIMTFHDLSFLHHPDFFSIRQRFWHHFQNYATQAKQAAHIIAVSEFTKSDIINFLKIPEERISVIYSGINDDFNSLPSNDESLLSFIKQHSLDFPFILYLGTLEPRKNIPALIRAFNILKQNHAYADLRLVLAGAPGWLYKNIIMEANRSPFKQDIKFFGPVNPRDRVFLYNKCIAFAYPSFFEGFGFPPLEAQKCGAPVVASNRTSLPEILEESAILINPWKIEELAGALEAAINQKEKWSRLGLQNSSRFNWKKTAEKTLQILEHYAKK